MAPTQATTPSSRPGAAGAAAGIAVRPARPLAGPVVHAAAAAVEPKSAPIGRAEIERAAYLLWLERGGDATENWLRAEAELKARAALDM